jgi:hypothetical protein
VKYIKSIKKRYKKDKTWFDDFINEMKYGKIKDLKTFKKKIKQDSELLPWLITEYEVDFEELLNYPKQQIHRNYLIKAIEKINTKLNLVEKTDIYSISTEQLYKHLATLIKKYKDKIPDKDINKILQNFDETDHLDYTYNVLASVVEKKIKKHLQLFLNVSRRRLDSKRNILENLKERVYSDNIEYFVSKIVKRLTFIYNPSKRDTRKNLNDSGLGRIYFKILTDDGKIEVDDVDHTYSYLLYNILRNQYEQYLILNYPTAEIHNSIMPIGFIVGDIKTGADSQFASIASCMDDNKVMEIISKKSVQNKNIIIKNFGKNLSKVRINAKNNYISSERVNKAQQLIRELTSNFAEEYLNSNPYLIACLSIFKSQQSSSLQYRTLPLPFTEQSYHPYAEKNMGLSDIEMQKVSKELEFLVTQSEYLNPDYLENSVPVYWGDGFSWDCLDYIFYKYFGILLIYISGVGKYIQAGKYISWFVNLELHKVAKKKDKAKYAIFLTGSPKTNQMGIHYRPMYYVENNEKIKLFSIDKTSSEFKKYADPLKDFIDDLTYFEK